MTQQLVRDAAEPLEFERWPQVEGEVTVRDVRILCLPAGRVNISVRRAAHTINVALNSNVVDMAFNSDSRSTRTVVAGSIGYFPKESTMELRCENEVPECLIEIGDETMQHWHDLADFSEPQPFGDQNPYVFDGPAADLARLGVHYLSNTEPDLPVDKLMWEAFVLGIASRYISVTQGLPSKKVPANLNGGQDRRNYQLKRSMEYALEHLSDRDLRISDMADAAEMSAYHFSDEFKRSFGLTPYSYIKEERLKYARDLTLHTSLPLKEVAHRAGFSSQSHMTTAFRMYFGMSPAKLRKK